MEGSAELRIVLLGKTGAGKSSTANSILGEKLFETSCLGNSDTKKCKAETKTVDGRKITVIDTPGFFCTECPDEELKCEIVKCITECSPGPHTFLIVLTVGRQTPEEKNTVEKILKMFGEEALKYAVVLFTNGDKLDDNVTIRQFVDKNSHLKTLVQKCGNRFHVIDNKYWNNPTEGHDERSNATQIKKLMNTIDQMVERKGVKHYTNEMLQVVEQAIKEEMAKGKTREKAKQSVMKRFLILAAGITTGSLCGALLGLATCAGVVTASVFALTLAAIKSPAPALTVATGVQTVATAGTGTRGVGAVASKVGTGLAVVAAVGVSAGAITGGIIGANAVSEAETVGEAVQRAAAAVTDTAEAAAKTITKKMNDLMKEPKA